MTRGKELARECRASGNESGAVAHAASPVGDAGGHDGSEGGVSASIELPEPPLRHCRNLQFTAAPTGSGVSGGRALCMQDVLSRALFRQTQQILWETPEVTTAAKAACQSASNCLTHRFATVDWQLIAATSISATATHPDPHNTPENAGRRWRGRRRRGRAGCGGCRSTTAARLPGADETGNVARGSWR